MSSCFRNSQMTCLTCHKPHAGESAWQDARGLLTKNGSSQAAPHRWIQSGIAGNRDLHILLCTRRQCGEYATQIVLTDHYIQRQKPLRDPYSHPLLHQNSPDLRAKTRTRRYYPEQLPDRNDKRLYLALAWRPRIRNRSSRRSPFTRNSHYANLHPTNPATSRVGARCIAELEAMRSAIPWFQESISDRSSDDRKTIKALTEALIIFSGSLDQAQQLLKDAVNRPPPDARLLANLGNVYARQGNSMKRNPRLTKPASQSILSWRQSFITFWVWSGKRRREICRGAGTTSIEKAIQNRPDLAESRNNLAKATSGQRQMVSAKPSSNSTQALASSSRSLRKLITVPRCSWSSASDIPRQSPQLREGAIRLAT